MKNFFKPLAFPLAAVSLCFLLSNQALASEANEADASHGADTGFAANVYFTDEFGNRRDATAEERAELAKRFQSDLAKLQGKNKGKLKQTQHANGAVSAPVALSKLQFLTVQENGDGTRSFNHQTMDESGNVSWESTNEWPEK